MTNVLTTLHSRIKQDDRGCWNWIGRLDMGGYGRTEYQGRKNISAHRLFYEEHVGPIPEGLEIDHLCRNRACCNPAHLEPVTRQENARRAAPFHASLKITDAQVVELRKMHAAGGHTQRALAQHFGISATLVNFIVTGKRKV